MVLFFSAESLEEYAEEHADVHQTHRFTICDLYSRYLYIYRYIYTYIWCKQQAYIYINLYMCLFMHPKLRVMCIIYVKMSKRRVNGPLMSLPKLSGQRSGRKGLQRFRKGLMHLLFRRFFFHLSLLPLVEHGNIGSITMAFPCFLGSTKTMENGAGLWKR